MGKGIPRGRVRFLPVGKIQYVPRWVIDGMNVIGSRADGWWLDREGAMTALVERLDVFASARREPVTVVFDGEPPEEAREATRVYVLAARRAGRNAADDEIARLVRRDAESEELCVVTSDRDLAGRVRGLGASVVSAGSFLRLLDRASPP